MNSMSHHDYAAQPLHHSATSAATPVRSTGLPTSAAISATTLIASVQADIAEYADLPPLTTAIAQAIAADLNANAFILSCIAAGYSDAEIATLC